MQHHNYLLQKKYNEILAKRFPGSKSEETTAHQTPIRSLKQSSSSTHKKYNFKISKQIKAQSKEFFKIDPSKKWRLPSDKFSIANSSNSSKFTKRKLLNSLKEKLMTPNERGLKFKKATKRSRYIPKNSIHNRSESLPNIMNNSATQDSDYQSQNLSSITKPRNVHGRNFKSNQDLNIRRNSEEEPYGKSEYHKFTKRAIRR